MEYLRELLDFFLSNVLVFTLLVIWETVWKLLAMWKAAQHKQPIWFVILGLLNTVGLLSIIYYFFVNPKK